MGGAEGILIFALIFGLYFLPSLIALIRKHRNQDAIAILNLFLGWTFIGWIVALVWAFTADVMPTSEVKPNEEKSFSPDNRLVATPLDSLEQLNQMRDKGLITNEEFDSKKKLILDSL